MKLKVAKREDVYLKLGLEAVSGGGKTFSSILLSKGLVGDLSKVCIIDTENGSSNLYSNLGNYNVLELSTFSPMEYIKAIDLCIAEGMKCIIIDSITHEWEWCLAYHVKLGGRYQDWATVTPLHDSFRNKMLQSPVHIITSVRKKQKYELAKDSTGKNVVNKLGVDTVFRDGWEYEVTANFSIDEDHKAHTTKDRTQIFDGTDPFLITEETGITLKNWLLSSAGNDEKALQQAFQKINNANSKEELLGIFNEYESLNKNGSFKEALNKKKEELTKNN